MPLHAGSVRPVTIRDAVESERLGTTALRHVGYVAACSCGFAGPVRVHYNEAKVDYRRHRRDSETP